MADIVASESAINRDDLIGEARNAQASKKWDEALRLWQDLISLSPDVPEAWHGGAIALRELKRYFEAEDLLMRAQERFPENEKIAELRSWNSLHLDDWHGAELRWKAFREVFPLSPVGYVGLFFVLRRTDRFDEMDDLMSQAVSRFSDRPDIAIHHASIAASRHDWPEAAARYRHIRHKFPSEIKAVYPLILALTQMGLQTEVEEVYQEAYKQFPSMLIEGEAKRLPGYLDVAIRYALSLNARRLWSEAQEYWVTLDETFPGNKNVLAGKAEVLWMLKDEVSLVDTLEKLLKLDPNNLTAAILYARLELWQNRPADATARLTLAAAHWPDKSGLLAELNDARMQALVALDETEAVTSATSEIVQLSTSDSLFAQFESLGSGCEFGILQRRFGIEPLGLLRWANITCAGLIQAMEERFARIGDTATTVLRTVGDRYVLMDRAYDLGMQTFIFTNTEPADTLLPKLCRRQRYLARILMENMEEGARILVYKSTEAISQDDIQRLWRAIRAYGNSALLIVQLANPSQPKGTLSILENGLMIGTVDHFSNEDIAVDDWTSICVAALGSFRRISDTMT